MHRHADEQRVRGVRPIGGPVRELTSLNRTAFEQHLLALGPEDRRLRFGTPPPGSMVRVYVSHIDFQRAALFGLVSDHLALRGAAHLARGEDPCEVGVSMLPEYRVRGFSGALLERAMLRSRNW